MQPMDLPFGDRPVNAIEKSLLSVYFAGRNDYAIPLFLKANVPPVSFLYYESLPALMYDLKNGPLL